MIKEGQIVTSQFQGTAAFKVLKLRENGQFATIQAFNVSKQITLGPTVDVPTSTLSPFKEDASQAAARIVREATEGN